MHTTTHNQSGANELEVGFTLVLNRLRAQHPIFPVYVAATDANAGTVLCFTPRLVGHSSREINWNESFFS
jgi:hypothetical protein